MTALETVLKRLEEIEKTLEKKIDGLQKTVDVIREGLSEEFGDDLFEADDKK